MKLFARAAELEAAQRRIAELTAEAKARDLRMVKLMEKNERLRKWQASSPKSPPAVSE